MNQRIARTLACSLLAAGIVAVPAAGSAFAAPAHATRGSEQFYQHEVQANTEHVSYSESTTYHAASDCYGEGGYGNDGYRHHQNGLFGRGILGLGLLGL
ncbi:hypothetical protein [Kitasatospora sp. NPDC094015]|uniref:hypothetical protein n=1 Tax=Kitasatospora sp. NPDC094015 TaxID=3155205 RepID=UPI003323C2EB